MVVTAEKKNCKYKFQEHKFQCQEYIYIFLKAASVSEAFSVNKSHAAIAELLYSEVLFEVLFESSTTPLFWSPLWVFNHFSTTPITSNWSWPGHSTLRRPPPRDGNPSCFFLPLRNQPRGRLSARGGVLVVAVVRVVVEVMLHGHEQPGQALAAA